MPLSLLILVAAIQGLTEFLPISSSGHLVLVPIVTDFVYQGRMIDVAAHVGTLIAVAFYLHAEIIAIAVAMLRFGRNDPETCTAWHHACSGNHSGDYRWLYRQLCQLAVA